MITTPLYWVNGPWAGRLAIASRPRGGDWLADELHAWHESGADVVVSTLTAAEMRELDLATEEADCRREGMDFESLPVTDRGTPDSRPFAVAQLMKWERALHAGKTLVVHCRQGVDRSALVAASLLTLAGIPPGESWRRVREARRAPVPDTSEQEAWVTGLASEASGSIID